MFVLAPRAAIVVVLVLGLMLAKRLYAQYHQRLQSDSDPTPKVPTSIVAGADTTWVVFTTPYCASCGPLTEQLQAAHPTARVVKVDATEETELASAFRVRTAPTALLADATGTVRTRLAGAGAMSDYVRSPQ